MLQSRVKLFWTYNYVSHALDYAFNVSSPYPAISPYLKIGTISVKKNFAYENGGYPRSTLIYYVHTPVHV